MICRWVTKVTRRYARQRRVQISGNVPALFADLPDARWLGLHRRADILPRKNRKKRIIQTFKPLVLGRFLFNWFQMSQIKWDDNLPPTERYKQHRTTYKADGFFSCPPGVKRLNTRKRQQQWAYFRMWCRCRRHHHARTVAAHLAVTSSDLFRFTDWLEMSTHRQYRRQNKRAGANRHQTVGASAIAGSAGKIPTSARSKHNTLPQQPPHTPAPSCAIFHRLAHLTVAVGTSSCCR